MERPSPLRRLPSPLLGVAFLEVGVEEALVAEVGLEEALEEGEEARASAACSTAVDRLSPAACSKLNK